MWWRLGWSTLLIDTDAALVPAGSPRLAPAILSVVTRERTGRGAVRRRINLLWLRLAALIMIVTLVAAVGAGVPSESEVEERIAAPTDASTDSAEAPESSAGRHGNDERSFDYDARAHAHVAPVASVAAGDASTGAVDHRRAHHPTAGSSGHIYDSTVDLVAPKQRS